MNAVLTCWFRRPDAQRNGEIDPRPTEEITRALRESVTGADVHVLTSDRMRYPNFYLDRWPLYVDWLELHPDVQWVWCVDAGDVEMLREPWADMEPGVIYTGWETVPLHNEWMLNNHPAPFLQDFIRTQPGMLLNAGVLGGDRVSVLAFCQAMTALADEHVDLGLDMGPFNWVAYRVAEKVITGHQVTTVFKGYEPDNGLSWWRHK